MENISQLLAINIKAARKIKGWTQTDLAVASGVSFRGIQDIETGRRSPRKDTLSAIAGALGVSERSLYKGVAPLEEPSRSDLIVELVTLLPSLNETELRILLRTARSGASLRKKSSSVG